MKLFPDLFITLPVLLLLSLGILIIYSSSPQLATLQALVGLFGLGIFWGLSFVDFELLRPYFKYLYWGIFILLITVFILGIETRGSLRWISLGFFQLQPSEFTKPVLILFLAKFWASCQPSWKNIFKSLLFVLPFLGLIFKQPDLGTALTISMIWVFMLLGANISFFKLTLMGIISTIFLPSLWFFLKDYQRMRFLSFLSPASDPQGAGYNVIQSMIAVGSGEFLGRGLGRGTQSRLQFLPEFRTDFIFASMAEELGFIVSVSVLVLYGIILARSLKITISTNRFGGLLIFGVLGLFFFQIVVNIGMNIGIMPVTGITLPLLSYGGSSLLSTLICLGFLASVFRYKNKNHFPN